MAPSTENDLGKELSTPQGSSSALSQTDIDEKSTSVAPEQSATRSAKPEGSNPASSEAQTAPPPPHGGHTFPDGGVRAWLVVLGGFIALFCSFGYLNAFGVYESYYQEFILPDKSASAIAWIGSIQVCFLFAAGIVAGSTFDRFGASVIIMPASIGLVVSVMLTSICKKYWQFILAQGILGGICQGFLFTPSMGAVNHFFLKKRGAALGVTVAGSSFGGVIIPIMLDKMLSNPKLGFAWTVRIIGFMFLGLLAIACATIQGRLPRRKGQFLQPHAFKQPSYCFVVPGLFLMIWGLFTPFFYIPTYAIEKVNMSVDMSIYLVSILNAASFPGRVLPGILADRLGRQNMLILFPMVTSIIVWCWLVVESHAGLIVWTAVFGFTSGACVSLFPAVIAQITPNPRDIGTYMGMAMGIIGIAGLTGAPIAGALLNYGWVAPIAWSGSTIMLGACFLAASRLAFNRKLLVAT